MEVSGQLHAPAALPLLCLRLPQWLLRVWSRGSRVCSLATSVSRSWNYAHVVHIIFIDAVTMPYARLRWSNLIATEITDGIGRYRAVTRIKRMKT
jgi:hypothetical protein